MKYRLFIGNLSPSVTKEELKQKFESYFEGTHGADEKIVVGETEVRCKNEENFFGYIDLHYSVDEAQNDGAQDEIYNLKPSKKDVLPGSIRKCINVLDRTKWKGSSIKVQLAKESFLAKLKRERNEKDEEPKTNEDGVVEMSGPEPRVNSNVEQADKFQNAVDKGSDSGSSTESDSDSSSDDDPETSVKSQIPKFKGLGFYFNDVAPQSNTVTTAFAVSKNQGQFEGKKSTMSFNNQIESASSHSGVKFNRKKQQLSDQRRLQSLASRQDESSKKSGIIKEALDFTLKSLKNNNCKKNSHHSMELFGDEDMNESRVEAVRFDRKEQYEGEEGRKLLEMKEHWGFDERFQIDERFQTNFGEPKPREDSENEKRMQLNVLQNILGDSALNSLPASSNKGKVNSVIVQRFDPDMEDTKKKSSGPKPKVTFEKKEDESPNCSTNTADLQDKTNPSTYKVVSDLKSMFKTPAKDKEEENTGNFSLIAKFGSSPANEESKLTDAQPLDSSEGGKARDFWTSNPFKYDSSSEDEDNDLKPDKKAKKPKTNKDIFRFSFFFTTDDKRFKGLNEFFQKKDEDEEENFSRKRQELRTIINAKIRNATRKNAKRVLAIKRAIRKKKKYQKATKEPKLSSQTSFTAQT